MYTVVVLNPLIVLLSVYNKKKMYKLLNIMSKQTYYYLHVLSSIYRLIAAYW